MRQPLYSFASDRLIPVLLAALSLLVAGCASVYSVHEDICAQFAEHGKDADDSTSYVYSDADSESAAANFKRLPRGHIAYVRLYKMRLTPPQVNPCSYLAIQKDVYFQRIAKANLALEEIQEFYTANGTLITTKTEPLGNQFHATGYYTGDASLPIPPKAPPGKYRIVSKLVLKTNYKNKHQTTVLARTSASFQIVPRK